MKKQNIKKINNRLYSHEELFTIIATLANEFPIAMKDWIENEVIIFDFTTKNPLPNALIGFKSNGKSILDYVLLMFKKHGINLEKK